MLLGVQRNGATDLAKEFSHPRCTIRAELIHPAALAGGDRAGNTCLCANRSRTMMALTSLTPRSSARAVTRLHAFPLQRSVCSFFQLLPRHCTWLCEGSGVARASTSPAIWSSGFLLQRQMAAPLPEQTALRSLAAPVTATAVMLSGTQSRQVSGAMPCTGTTMRPAAPMTCKCVLRSPKHAWEWTCPLGYSSSSAAT